MFQGNYAFRFSGFTRKENFSFYLVGLGTMVIDGDVIKGSSNESSSITRLNDSGALLVHGFFNMKGKITGPKNGIYHAVIDFNGQTNDPDADGPQTLTGHFDMIPAGSFERFWLISTGDPDSPASEAVDEVVSGEGVRS